MLPPFPSTAELLMQGDFYKTPERCRQLTLSVIGSGELSSYLQGKRTKHYMIYLIKQNTHTKGKEANAQEGNVFI